MVYYVKKEGKTGRKSGNKERREAHRGLVNMQPDVIVILTQEATAS